MVSDRTQLFSLQNLESILKAVEGKKAGRQLEYVYSQVPSFSCKKCGDCCFNCSEVYFIEYLNIMNAIRKLPKSVQTSLLQRVVAYEFLNLAKPDEKCPFLGEEDCLIYSARPLACRFFGLYPEREYKLRKDDSLSANKELADFYAKNYGLTVPKSVIKYDVEQCDNNLDKRGNKMAMAFFERERLSEMLLSVEDGVVPEDVVRPRGKIERFSYFFIKNFLGEGEIFEIRLSLMKDFLETGETDAVENVISQYKIEF